MGIIDRHRELIFQDLCTIISEGGANEVDENGDPTYTILCENVPCDYQPSYTQKSGGVYTERQSKLFLPYDTFLTQPLSHGLTVFISKHRRSYSYKSNITDSQGRELMAAVNKYLTVGVDSVRDYLDTDEINEENEYKVENSNPYIVRATIENFIEENINNKLVGVSIELSELTY